MSFDLKTAIASIAPTLATMLGGPMIGTAVTALESALGLAPGSGTDAITKVLQNGAMTPENIAAIRAADQRHAENMDQHGIDVIKMNLDYAKALSSDEVVDRSSARNREIAVRGITTPALAWLVVGASVALGAAAIMGYITKDPTQATLVGTVIGYVFGESKTVLAYYFGSSAGSTRKDELLAQSTPADTK